uniref:Uncharacterized protein n=1 Tax=Chromera velia CCMP2878 TaxID=1169474 RepID=A0A0G4G1B3_9ALVE|eukprot:Cvel_19597.t1-p1 / transcript=Cvel_19597.t1 / gene=Cvel_19597 / organism=Chromera_velia_CCMP2878 / gene_product=hypothetical protein / transcript_product=hypothetical protein / location=Cvel_scaffold1703:15678-16394(-) / protein_length=239 / sequence_SO=supercontig / SO=protein_coding / is_pseudo=false
MQCSDADSSEPEFLGIFRDMRRGEGGATQSSDTIVREKAGFSSREGEADEVRSACQKGDRSCVVTGGASGSAGAASSSRSSSSSSNSGVVVGMCASPQGQRGGFRGGEGGIDSWVESSVQEIEDGEGAEDLVDEAVEQGSGGRKSGVGASSGVPRQTFRQEGNRDGRSQNGNEGGKREKDTERQTEGKPSPAASADGGWVGKKRHAPPALWFGSGGRIFFSPRLSNCSCCKSSQCLFQP